MNSTTNISPNVANLPAAVAGLTHRELVELFRRLNGGTAGFDTGRYKKAELLTVAAAWIAQGVPPAVMESHAQAVIAARASAATVIPPAPAPVAYGVVTLPPYVNPMETNAERDARNAAPFVTTGRDRAVEPMSDAELIACGVPAADVAALPPAQTIPAPARTDDVREAILAAIALTTPAPQPAPQPMIDANGMGIVPIPAQPSGIAAIIAAAQPAENAPQPAATDAQAAPAMPPMQDVPQPAPDAPAPAGREYARTLFRDCPPAVVQAIPATLTVPVFSHPDAEAPDASYRFNAATLVPALIAMATSPTFRVWFGGPRGTGKTEFARQIAARTGRVLYRVNFSRFTESSEIIGDMGLKEGATVWADGPVAAACRVQDGAAVLLLDELTYATPGAISCLNPLLERNGALLRLPRTGEVLQVPANLFVVAADNTFGCGDASGEYAARNELGSDTRDRFQVKLAFDYLPAADEKALLRDAVMRECGRKPSAAAIAPLLKILHVSREKAGLGELQGAPSFRGAVAFATLLAYGMPPAEAFTLTIVQGAPEESHEALRTIFSAHWPTNATGGIASFFEGI
jgi:MoxR-like ATPase